MIYFIIIILLILAAEISARLIYLKKHGIKFVPKRIGEYPYNKFIEECGPPLHWRLKPGYGENQVHINSLGLRSLEPVKGCRHIWVVGESDFFGAKLACEEKIWFKVLQNQLDREGYNVRVMNASVIGYNSLQATTCVLQLPIKKDDILLLRPNINDISIAYMQGSEWEKDSPWPLAFVHKLERHKPWLLKLVDMSCIGNLLRRRFFKEKNVTNAFVPKPGFSMDRVLDHQEDCLGQMIEFGRSKGAKIGLFTIGFCYGPAGNPGDGKKLAAIQDNWQSIVKNWAAPQSQLMEEMIKRVAQPEKIPVLDIASHIWQHPDRYHLFLDMLHCNEKGHEAVAKALYEELVASGLLSRKE